MTVSTLATIDVSHPLARIPEPAATKIAVRQVSMRFGTAALVPVLDDLNLDVRAGEFLCLVGPSGCGKSTLLKILAGFLRPSGGVVEIDGDPLVRPDPRRIFVFQEQGVFPWLTVGGNIGFGLEHLSRADRAQRIAEYVTLVGLTGFERMYPRALSGGMKQRVEVARALAVSPDVLFMDEPFSALDYITRLGMRALLLRIWNAQRKTILLVTHDVDEAVQLADRVVVLGSRPATVQTVIEVDIPHPRDISARRYLEIRDGLLAEIGLAHQI